MLVGFEGEILKVYKDPIGLPTLGVGHLVTPAEKKDYPVGKKITRAESREFLRNDLRRFEDAVNNLVKVPITQNQFDALTSFAFNVGEGNLKRSSVLRNLNNRKFDAAANSFLAWNRAGGKVLDGLTRRRHTERSVFLTPDKVSAAGVTMPVQENPKAALAATGASSPTSEVLQTGLPAINAPAADIPPPEQTQPSVTNTVVEQKIIEETPVGLVTTTKTAETVAAPVEVQKETPSWLVKIGAPFTILTGWGINAGSLIQSRIEQMTVQQIGYMIAAIGLIALGIWWWMRAAKAAQNRTMQLVDKAADPNLTTVILTDRKPTIPGQWRYVEMPPLPQQPASVTSPVPSE